MSRRKRQKNGMINNENENKIDSAEPENNSMTQQTVEASPARESTQPAGCARSPEG